MLRAKSVNSLSSCRYGVKMLCANLEGASLVSCNFDDPAGSAANMEGVNLKEATLEGSNMARVNLRYISLDKFNKAYF